jgi:hypothetical protein
MGGLMIANSILAREIQFVAFVDGARGERGRCLWNHAKQNLMVSNLWWIAAVGLSGARCLLVGWSVGQARSASVFCSLFSRAAASTHGPASVPPASFCFHLRLP